MGARVPGSGDAHATARALETNTKGTILNRTGFRAVTLLSTFM